MSTSLLYHAFGLRGYDYVKTEYTEGTVVFTVRQRPHTCRCPQCGSRDLIHHGQETRPFKTVPIGHKPVLIVLPIPRVECRHCQIVRQVTAAFRRSAPPLHQGLRALCLGTVPAHDHPGRGAAPRVGWDTIKDIQKRDLQHRFKKPRLGKLKQIAIDEISIGHGHRYLTVVLNLETGAVVFVGEGKGADALEPFWGRLRAARAQVEAVATDMSPAYIQAVRENLGDAIHVFDHFHVIKLFNEKLSDFRRELYHEATEKMDKEVLKGTRWLLLKNPENLDPKRNERERLEEALRMNQPLATVYYLKEDCGRSGTSPTRRRRRASWRTGFAGRKHRASRCSRSSPAHWRCTGRGSWPTTTAGSRRVRWKGRTTRSRPCSGRRMASATRSSSSSKSWLSTKPSTLYSDEPKKIPATGRAVGGGFAVGERAAVGGRQGAWLVIDRAGASAGGAGDLRRQGLGLLLQKGGERALGQAARGG